MSPTCMNTPGHINGPQNVQTASRLPGSKAAQGNVPMPTHNMLDIFTT